MGELVIKIQIWLAKFIWWIVIGVVAVVMSVVLWKFCFGRKKTKEGV